MPPKHPIGSVTAPVPRTDNRRGSPLPTVTLVLEQQHRRWYSRGEIRTHHATKADLANLENRLTWRFGSALIAVGTLVVLAVKYLPGGAS